MSSLLQGHRGLATAMLLAACAGFSSIAEPVLAQDQSTSAVASPQLPQAVVRPARTFPKVEIFGGYSFLYPNTTLNAINPGATLPVAIGQESNPRGVGAALTYNFTRWLGVTADFSGHWGSGEAGPNLPAGDVGSLDDSRFYNASIGPKLTYRKPHFAPFVEALGGWHRLSSEGYGSSDAIGFIGGAGIDVPLTRHFGLRPFQGDYVFSNHQFGPSGTVPQTELRGVRLQAGAIFMFGGAGAAAPVTYSCSTSPTEVYPGEPITATGTALALNPKKAAGYHWTSAGGKVNGGSTVANVDTTGLAAGTYTVGGHVTEGTKAGQSADCSTTFVVKPFDRPTITVSADPSSVDPGGSSAITSHGLSPQNRPLTYSFSTSAGRISGSSGNTATLDTTGVAPEVVTVTGNLTDDLGQTATATTLVTINTPAPQQLPPPAKTQTLCALDFGRDPRRPTRVNNEAKACLDEVALSLQHYTDAKAVLVGNSGEAERHAATLAAERAVNAKAYLVDEKGIDASRIEVRTGSAGTPSVEDYMVPAGGTFTNDIPGTASVDTSTVKASRKAYGHSHTGSSQR